MVWSLLSAERRRTLASDATRARDDQIGFIGAIIAVTAYNVVGVFDIISTHIAVSSGLGAEANPVIRTAMEQFGLGWIAMKLMLQTLITVMVLWFPHRIVVAMFATAVALNTVVVLNNFAIITGG